MPRLQLLVPGSFCFEANAETKKVQESWFPAPSIRPEECQLEQQQRGSLSNGLLTLARPCSPSVQQRIRYVAEQQGVGLAVMLIPLPPLNRREENYGMISILLCSAVAPKLQLNSCIAAAAAAVRLVYYTAAKG